MIRRIPFPALLFALAIAGVGLHGLGWAQEADPNDPTEVGISRDERIRRQEALVRKQLREAQVRRQREAQERLKAKQEGRDPDEQMTEAESETPRETPAPETEATPEPPNVVVDPLADRDVEDSQGRLEKIEGQTKTDWAATVKKRDGAEMGYREVTFFLTPGTVVVQTGEEFATEVRLLTLDKTPANRFEIIIAYPPDIMQPIAIHQDRLVRRIKGKPNWGIDREVGVIRYEVELTKPIAGLSTSLLEVVWKGLKPAESVTLELHHQTQLTSRAWLEDFLLTKNEFGEVGALVGATVSIEEPMGNIPPGERLVVNMREDFAPALGELNAAIERARPAFALSYDKRIVYEAGEHVVYDVYLTNPDEAAFDEIRIGLKFDPDRVEILDTDEGNSIQIDGNILDGPFRDAFGWEHLLRNRINVEKGIIDYRMGWSRLQKPESGIVARIFVRVKQTTANPLLQWIWDQDAGWNEAGTGIYILGENMFDRYSPAELVNAAEFRSIGIEAEKADPTVYREPPSR